MLKKLKLGLIASPDLPAQLTNKFVNDLPTYLPETVDDTVEWEPQIVIDPLVGAAEYLNQLMDKAVHLKEINDWDYVICLTDLPHFMDKYVVVADVNILYQIALISIPAFGAFPVKQRTKRTIATVLNNMHHANHINRIKKSRQAYKKANKKSFLLKIHPKVSDTNADISKQMTSGKHKKEYSVHDEQSENRENEHDEVKKHTKDTFTQENTEEMSDIRYILYSKLLGYIRILAGMTFANRPWSALISFKKIILLAFGTGIYITLFPTPWELSTIYSIPRFLLLMFIAIFSMVTWIIFAHQLWEKPTKKGDVRLRKLYNYTTISTLSIIVLINYIVLFCLLLAAIGIFVPPGLFEAGTDLKEEATMKHYFQLVWLITSLGTLAGSIGTMSENEDKIRHITYSYRQINRYYEIQDKHKKVEKQTN